MELFNPFKLKLPDNSSEYLIGNKNELLLICGPCVIESREHVLRHAEKIKKIIAKIPQSEVKINLVFKASYDKANRTSGASFRGVGLEQGISILSEVRKEFNLPVISDIHTEQEVIPVSEVVDILQIPAFLCRQTDLLVAAASGKKPILIKKGQFLHPSDMKYSAEKIKTAGENRILFCERGSCFGYRDLVVDFKGLLIMKEIGRPVIFDATHSVQSMGGLDGKSGGASKFVPHLARAAMAFGIDGLFLECHENPELAPSDGPNMIKLSELESVILDMYKIKSALLS